MEFTFIVAAENGHYRASVFGAPEESATADTRDAAVETLRSRLEVRASAGEFVTVNVEPLGLAPLAGKYRDDPTLQEICDQAYRYRDELKRQEFGE